MSAEREQSDLWGGSNSQDVLRQSASHRRQELGVHQRARAGDSGPDQPLGLWKARQAAKFLVISERHLWTLTQRGEIPVVRLGASLRYDPADLRALIAARKQKAGT